MALGNVFLDVLFVNTSPGAPLVDLGQLTSTSANSSPPPALQFIAFRAVAKGPLASTFGVPAGTPGICTVSQSGLYATFLATNPGSRVGLDAFPAELVDLHALGT